MFKSLKMFTLYMLSAKSRYTATTSPSAPQNVRMRQLFRIAEIWIQKFHFHKMLGKDRVRLARSRIGEGTACPALSAGGKNFHFPKIYGKVGEQNRFLRPPKLFSSVEGLPLKRLSFVKSG